jgi:hypothetical protein
VHDVLCAGEKTVRLALVEKESSERQNELQVLRDLRDRLRAELAELTRVHEQQVNKPVVAVSVPIVASVTPTQQSDAAVAAPTSTTSAQSSSRLPQPAQTRKINLAQAHRAPVCRLRYYCTTVGVIGCANTAGDSMSDCSSATNTDAIIAT